MEAEVTVDFDEAALGCEKVIRLSGSDGKIQSFKVRIPAGMDDGEQLRLKSKGHTGADGTTGDLFLKIKIRPKNGCERKGLDVYTTVTIPYVTAALGGKARIHTLYGDVDCNIKGGTQDGSKIRLRGKGIVSRKNPSIHGDQYVKVQIQVPKYLSPEAKKKLQEYSMMC
ncbi:dnaJ-class molecular chaperone with C-terminal Zn finger domain [Roseburia intestinalis CAG:13]|nr:dnaJ-class molecular chaperone with C-terminal Zn finger domain [Roseburia intestinalis CAG:13]